MFENIGCGLRAVLQADFLKDRRFWLVQAIVAGIALSHDLLEGWVFSLPQLYYLPIGLFWAPVIYAAWEFSFVGAAATALWVVAASIPNFLFWHQGSGRLWEISQLLVTVIFALGVAYLSNKKGMAPLRARVRDDRALKTYRGARKTGRNLSFWTVQFAAAILVFAHSLLEEYAPLFAEGFEIIAVGAFWVPVIYSAWFFGFAGATATALLIVAASVPYFIFFHQRSSRLEEGVEILTMVSVALAVGYLVDQKRTAHVRATLYAEHALKAQETERQKISRDIHDGAIQSLVTVCRKLDGIRYFTSALPPSASSDLLEVRQAVEQAANDLRDLARELRPPALDDLGLVSAMRGLLADLEKRTGIRTAVELVGEEGQLLAEEKIGLFRIAREALHNVERHAQATRVTVTISFASGTAMLEIIDNGVGFDRSLPRDSDRARNFGILGMYENAELLGGRLEIDSGPGKGTRVRVKIYRASPAG